MIPHDDTRTRQRRAAVRPSEDVVVARLRSMAPSLDGEPDPAFRAAARARVVAMAAVRTPAPEPVSRTRAVLARTESAPARWRARLTAGVAGAALAVTALATLVAVSTNAGPGDALYGLKRGTEQTQLALAGDSTRGRTLLDFASTRLAELRTLVDDDATAAPLTGAGETADGTTVLAAGASPELVLETMRTMDAETTEGAASLDSRAVTTGSTAPLELLSDWAATQSSGLAGLRGDLPAEAADALTSSLGLLTAIDARVAGLRTALGCATGPATRGSDDLGPLPVPCPRGTSSTGAPGTGSGTTPQGGLPGSTGTTGGTSAGGGVGSGTGTTGSSGAAGSTPSLPTGQLPAPPTDSTRPTLPLPTVPNLPVPVPTTPSLKLPLPSVTLPGATIGTPKATSSAPLLDLCIPPVSLGGC